MARINLLPWRAEERERKNRDFVTLLALATLLAIAAAFATWYFFNLALDTQQKANKLIETENTKLDAKLSQIDELEVRREAIISRMKVIRDLQGRRPVPVHVWNDVAKAIPADMYLIKFSRNDNKLTFTGRAANPNIVSNLVTNLDASPWMEGARVSNIQQKSVNAYSSATLEINEYPESNYADFVVTTSIASTLPEYTSEDEQANQNSDNNAAVMSSEVARGDSTDSNSDNNASTMEGDNSANSDTADMETVVATDITDITDSNESNVSDDSAQTQTSTSNSATSDSPSDIDQEPDNINPNATGDSAVESESNQPASTPSQNAVIDGGES